MPKRCNNPEVCCASRIDGYCISELPCDFKGFHLIKRKPIVDGYGFVREPQRR